MIKNLPFQFKDLEVHIQKMLVRLGVIEKKVDNNELPIGSIISWTSKTSLPIGFLECKGQDVSRITYDKLFKIIGTKFGAGNGSSTFNLPNGQGLVLRGEGTQSINGRTKDGGSLGDKIEDQFQGHLVSSQGISTTGVGSGSPANTFRNVGRDNSAPAFTIKSTLITDDTNGTPRTGNETQASSLSVIFIIRAQNLSTADATESAVDALNSRVTDLENKSPVRYIVNTSSSGNNWYEVYNDGWVRQGQYYHQAGGTTYTRTFGVPMRSSAYTLSLSPHVSATSTIQYRSFGHTFLSTGFSGYTGTSTDFISWSCEGFGNSSAVTALGANPNY